MEPRVHSAMFRFRNITFQFVSSFFGCFWIRYIKKWFLFYIGSDSVSKKYQIPNLVTKKVSDSVSFRFGVTSHTARMDGRATAVFVGKAFFRFPVLPTTFSSSPHSFIQSIVPFRVECYKE